MNPKALKISPPSDSPISIRVNKACVRHLKKGHPWLFDGSITHQNKPGKTGDLAVIYDDNRKYVGLGLLDPDEMIRVKMLTRQPASVIDSEWFLQAIKKAIALRSELADSNDTNGYRIIHGENDGFPGLILDKYDDTFVLKIYSMVWFPYLPMLLPIIQSELTPNAIILRLSRAIAKRTKSEHDLTDGDFLLGKAREQPYRFLENGIIFEVDPVKGQKTGFFLDQRDNRARCGELSKGQTVLNVCSFSGGFSIYAAKNGATEVTSLDQSGFAIEMAKHNFELNKAQTGTCQHLTIVGDAFEELRKLHAQNKQYDLIIIDPPSFAKNQSQVEEAQKAYARLASLGLSVLKRGGTIVLASCSSRVTREEFVSTVKQAAKQSRRPFEVFLQTQHAIDHPIGFDEGAYLKCVYARCP